MRTFIRLAVVIAIGFMVAALASPAGAQTATNKKIKQAPVTPISDIAGGATFQAYCSACHGAGGHGNGPAAWALKAPPSDLTLISKRAGGQFPFASVRSKIAGDEVIAAHGSREMPTWGPLFKAVDSSTSVAELRLANLVKYLEEIQAK